MVADIFIPIAVGLGVFIVLVIILAVSYRTKYNHLSSSQRKKLKQQAQRLEFSGGTEATGDTMSTRNIDSAQSSATVSAGSSTINVDHFYSIKAMTKVLKVLSIIYSVAWLLLVVITILCALRPYGHYIILLTAPTAVVIAVILAIIAVIARLIIGRAEPQLGSRWAYLKKRKNLWTACFVVSICYWLLPCLAPLSITFMLVICVPLPVIFTIVLMIRDVACKKRQLQKKPTRRKKTIQHKNRKR